MGSRAVGVCVLATAVAAAVLASPAVAQPSVRITVAPTRRTTDSTAVFRWRTSAETRFTTCRLVGKTFTSASGSRRVVRGFRRCSSPKVWSNLRAGRYVFVVRAYNARGQHTQARYRWTILGSTSAGAGAGAGSRPQPPPPPPPPPPPTPTPPSVSLTQTPASVTGSTSATFAWSTTGTVTSTSCSIDGGASAACTSPRTYGSLALGSHTFSVTVSGSAGSASASYSWTITGSTSGCATAPYRYLTPVHPEINAEEQRFVDLVNQARQALGVGPLTINSRLSIAADSHSYWQDKTYGGTGLSHSGCGGSDPGARITDAGYRWSTWGEVTLVHSAGADALTAFNMFKSSAPHWRLLTSASFTEIGVGQSAYHWTGDLGG